MAGQSRFSMSATISLIDKVTAPMGYALKSIDNFSDKVRGRFGTATKSANTFGGSVGNIIKGVIGANLLERGLMLIVGGFKKAVSGAAMFESSLANFTTLLGGNEQSAKNLVKQLQILGAETPFEFKQLAKVVETLLPTMDGNIEQTIKTVRMLGDTAGGNADKLDRITRGFTKAMLKGKVDMESLNMIAEAGVPIHTELAKSMGFGKDQMTAFFKKVSTGTVSTEQLVKVFEQMTSEGGLFFGGMIRSSKTFDGVMSNMNDAMNLTFAGIGEAMLPTLKELAISITSTAVEVLKWVQSNKELIGKSFKSFTSVLSAVVKTIWFLRYVILAAVGAYTAFKIAVALSYIPLAIGTAITWAAQAALWVLIAAEYAASAASWVMNTALYALGLAFALGLWPIILIIAAIAAFIAIGVLLYKYWEPVSAFFSDLWTGIKDSFSSAINWIIAKFTAVVDYVIAKWNAVKSFLGFGDGNMNVNQNQTITPAGAGGGASPNNRGTNSTTTTNGKLSIDVNANSQNVTTKQEGKLPANMSLAYGRAN